MAETYRVPKALKETAETIDSPLATLVRESDSITLENVVAIRNAWQSEWANDICEKIQRDAEILQSSTEPTEPTAEEPVEERKSDLVEELTELLGDIVTFYFRAHGAHWNVVGPNFSEYHELFNEIYEDAYGSIDPIAENLRKLGAPAPFQLPAFAALSSIEDTNPGEDARSLAADLLAANEILIQELSETFACATEHNQQGIANFLADRIDNHQKWKWQLAASLGQEADPADPIVEETPAEEAKEEATTEEPTRKADDSMIEERKNAIATAERITMQAEVRAMDTEDGSLRIGGYAATFGAEATGLNFREVIAPGAFTRTLQTDNPVFLLINHDTESLPLASTQSGTLRLTEDEVGLRMEADLDPSNPRAQELASALKRGDVDKMSFAFTVGPDGQTREEGLRTLTDLGLLEVSVVTWPAYDSTAVGMRSAEDVAADLDLAKAKLALKYKTLSLRTKRKG